ncbi:MAG: pantoate--beta-alanine ligase [Solirubrobacteraceae bacterium]
MNDDSDITLSNGTGLEFRDDDDFAAGGVAAPRMRTVRTISALRAALRSPRRAARRIGLVATMGALHDGHVSLIRRARAGCDLVVVTLFVNPAQFDDPSDLRAYPHDEQRDAQIAETSGADLLFVPEPGEIYPPGFATTVRVGGVSGPLEGAARGGEHFTGVATVVTKLLNIVQPDVAYFGQKDAQQVAVIRRLARDLDIPVEIEACPTVRDPDGLALSSRNARLRGDQRRRALALPRALDAARGAVGTGERDGAAITATARRTMRDAGVEPEYVELVSPDTFIPVRCVDGEPVLVAVAARVGDVRLIDNELLNPTEPATGSL